MAPHIDAVVAARPQAELKAEDEVAKFLVVLIFRPVLEQTSSPSSTPQPAVPLSNRQGSFH